MVLVVEYKLSSIFLDLLEFVDKYLEKTREERGAAIKTERVAEVMRLVEAAVVRFVLEA